ncbi:hypothetical protein F8388_010593 [Cannabis sativa]|uniref:Uncharacterized protein n=1 Tax=Cannabis sativa TaxID=3483 RepID=A0A7J6GPZ2_CANSA|nr:hypothetical protein F8388_010593 [Cannabis sativa]
MVILTFFAINNLRNSFRLTLQDNFSLEVSSHVGIIYINLKPKITLIKSDNHIMLTDFDLSLYSDTISGIVESLESSPDSFSFI